jgi:hypothetical protein
VRLVNDSLQGHEQQDRAPLLVDLVAESRVCFEVGVKFRILGSSYPDVWENRATTASRHVLADGGIDRRRRADTVPFGSVSVPPDRSYISKIFILRGDSGMLSRGGQGVCPVLDRALGRCSGLRCNWWKKMNGQGHSWLKVLHLDWNIPRVLEALRVFVLVHRKDV